MKTIKLLLFFFTFSAVAFYSCSDSDAIENNNKGVPKNSVALRTALNEIKQANNIEAKTTTNPFCFDFVFPVTFSYNNGTIITVTTFQGLIDLLANESPTFYMEGIVFPFRVAYGGAIHTINSENQFIALLEYCGFDTLIEDLEHTSCFDIVFPVQISQNNQNLTFDTLEALIGYLNSPNGGNNPQLVFPISVRYRGQIVVIHNLYEFYEMINNCDLCVCPGDYTPVCVRTPNGIMEYGNFCQAQCAGYTQNDLVVCHSSTACSISNQNVVLGSCNATGGYDVTLNFTYANPASTHFEIYDVNNQLTGTFLLSELPLTLPNFQQGTAGSGGSLIISIVNNPNCTAVVTWDSPVCSTPCNCPADFNPVCIRANGQIFRYTNACHAQCDGYTANDFVSCDSVQPTFGTTLGSCFFMNYPVQVVLPNQEIIQINNDRELLQYWQPATSAIPNMLYPVTVTFANTVYTFANQAQFQAQIAISCH